MIKETYYINNAPIKAQIDTGLAADEIEAVVGRFPRHHERQGHLKGEIVVYASGDVIIRHHFTKKVLWSSVL